MNLLLRVCGALFWRRRAAIVGAENLLDRLRERGYALPPGVSNRRRPRRRGRGRLQAIVYAGELHGIGPFARARCYNLRSRGIPITHARPIRRTTVADRLRGKHALVTAAGQGMGRAAAIAFAAEGARVSATDINPQLLESLAGIAGVATRALDVTDPAAIARVAAEVGDIDVLFNCAGYVHHGTIMECTERDWDTSFDINIKSMYRLTRAFLPGMLKRGKGSIINMSSIASSIRGLPNRLAYGTSKAAVIGFTKAVAADYVKQGIRCNAVCPGTIDTPSLAGRINALADPVQARQDFVARQPMGRLGTVDDIMGILVFLASDESLFATGNAYSIDGGLTI